MTLQTPDSGLKTKILNMMDVTACPEVLKPLEDIGEVVQLPANQTTLLERIGEFDGFLTSLEVRSDREMLQRAERLRAIATPSTGTDHIDMVCAAERGIEILSLKNDTEFLGRITATAELAWALLLSTVRRLPWACEAARRGHWARDLYRGHQLSTKTLGILGYGRLGRILADYGRAFRMRVLACDVETREMPEWIEAVDLDRLLRESDVISIHIHLTESNRGLFDAATLAKMKPGSILINTSRGAIVDEAALVQALENGPLAGAGLDVIEGEWRDDLDLHPLIRYANAHENLVISPHIGGVTYESQALAIGRTVEKLAEALSRLSI